GLYLNTIAVYTSPVFKVAVLPATLRLCRPAGGVDAFCVRRQRRTRLMPAYRLVVEVVWRVCRPAQGRSPLRAVLLHHAPADAKQLVAAARLMHLLFQCRDQGVAAFFDLVLYVEDGLLLAAFL